MTPGDLRSLFILHGLAVRDVIVGDDAVEVVLNQPRARMDLLSRVLDALCLEPEEVFVEANQRGVLGPLTPRLVFPRHVVDEEVRQLQGADYELIAVDETPAPVSGRALMFESGPCVRDFSEDDDD